VYNSTLGTQQKKLDKLKQESAYTEQKLEERDRTGKERVTIRCNAIIKILTLMQMRMLSETKLAINNIFDRIMSRNRPIAPNTFITFPPMAVMQKVLATMPLGAAPAADGGNINPVNASSNGGIIRQIQSTQPHAAPPTSNHLNQNDNNNQKSEDSEERINSASENIAAAVNSVFGGAAHYAASTKDTDNSIKTLTEKLHSIEEHIIDLQCIFLIFYILD
jgi:hypothetical protein